MLFEKLSKVFNNDIKTDFEIFANFNDSTDDTRVSDAIDWAKKEGYLARLGISEDSAEVLFRSILVDRNLPEELRNNPKLRDELIQVAIDKAGDRSPIPPAEAKRAYELIESGEIFNDIFYSLNAIFSLITKPDRFSNLDDSFKETLASLMNLPGSILSDFDPKSAIDKISTQIEQVREGKLPEDPVILDNTLREIYSNSEVGYTIDIISALLAPENESIRIALLVYARLNGINLEQKDIDIIRDTILDRENPNLGSLFSYLIPENLIRLGLG